MGIAVTCSGCQAQLNVRDDMAGAKGKCPKCGASLRIPAAASNHPPTADPPLGPLRDSPPVVAAVTSQPQTPQPQNAAVARAAVPAGNRMAVDSLFQGSVAALPVSAGYRVAVFLAAGYVAALAVLYYATVLGALVAIGWYTVSGFNAIAEPRTATSLAFYAATVTLGLIGALLLLKTVIAPAARSPQECSSVAPEAEPALIEFVQRIAREVGASCPQRIQLNCDIFVAAHPPRRWRAPFGRRLILTIGLPLVEGLSVQELGGAIAHELALFTRASGKRRAYIIRTVSEWFQRIVNEPDAWDIALLRAAHRRGLVGQWLTLPLRGAIALVRCVPRLFLVLAHGPVGFLMRQMELSADRYQNRLAGSDAFESVCKRRVLLQYALRGAQSDLEMFHRAECLPDNLPRFVIATAAQQPAEVRQTLLDLIDRFQTGPLDPRPADKERIAAARSERQSGVLRSDLPASALFANFEQTARAATLFYYASLFGKEFRQAAIKPVEDLIDCQALQEQGAEARKRFFLGAQGVLRPVRLPSPTVQPPSSAQLVQTQLLHQREEMQRLVGAYSANYALYAEAEAQWIEASRAVALFKAGLTPRADLFSTTFVSLHQARQVRSNCRDTLSTLQARLESFEWAAGQRLHAALTLLHAPGIAENISSAKLDQAQCDRLLLVVSTLAGHLEDVSRLRTDHARLVALVEHARGASPSPTSMQELQRRTGRVFRELKDLHGLLDHLDHPFPEEHRGTVARSVLASLPQANNLQAVLRKTQEFLDNVASLYGRCVDRLCAAAESVEHSLTAGATASTGREP